MLDDLRRALHLNLVEFGRESARWSGTRGRIEESDGAVLFATGTDFPALLNGAFRLDPSTDAELLLDRAEDFFGALGRGFTIQVDDTGADGDLAAAARARGLAPVLDSPEMVVDAPVEDRPLPDGVELRWVDDDDTMAAFIAVSADAYAVTGLPRAAVPEAITDVRAFTEPQVQSVVASLAGEPVAAAQTLLSHGIAGVYWVGTVESARGRGLGDAVTRAVTNRAFALGATCNSLQASRMGEPIYRRMGYETVYRYTGFVRFP